MGFIIWYKVEFKEQQLVVSNDVFSGQYILDADITVKMTPKETVDTFTITLINLPKDVADALKAKWCESLKGDQQPLLAKIYLGYFDEPASQSRAIMSGAILSVKNTVNQSGLLETMVEGQEIGGYKLRTTSKYSDGKEFTANDLLKQISEYANVPLASGSKLNSELKLPNFTSKPKNGLEALRELAEKIAKVPLVIRDDSLYIGPAVGQEKAPILDGDSNIVKQEEIQDIEEIDEPPDKRKDGKVQTKCITRFKLTVLGDPRLRVGQTAELKNPESKNLRIMEVIHTFSTKSGYTCDLNLVKANPGNPGEKVAEKMTGAPGVVRGLRDVMENVQSQKQAIDVGEVKAYEAGNQNKHRASLKSGQVPPPGNTTPSVEVEVNESSTLHSRPISSPFAWHKCGLMVPVYPGMRALLAHNLGLTSDAVVAGFLWSEQPMYERPKNEPGDYWLCLPTELGENNQPTGKGVNDLIDKDGLRVIQTKGLHIFVGDDKLPGVGERPQVPTAKTIVIEHESGTKIMIGSDGAITIQTNQKDISLSNSNVTLQLGGDGAVNAQTNGKDISLTNGSVTLKLGSSGVEVS